MLLEYKTAIVYGAAGPVGAAVAATSPAAPSSTEAPVLVAAAPAGQSYPLVSPT